MARIRLRDILAEFDPPLTMADLSRSTVLGSATIHQIFHDARERHRPKEGPKLGSLETLADELNVHVATLLVNPKELPDLIQNILQYSEPKDRQTIVEQIRVVLDQLTAKP